MAGPGPGRTPTMFRSPCWGPVLGNGSKWTSLIGDPGAEAIVSRRVTARLRSCGDPAGRCPTATCARGSDIALGASDRFAEEDDEDEESPPQPTPTSAEAARSAPASERAALRRLLALALDPRLGRDGRHCGLVMATGTIPD